MISLLEQLMSLVIYCVSINGKQYGIMDARNVFDPRHMRISIQGSGIYLNRERGHR